MREITPGGWGGCRGGRCYGGEVVDGREAVGCEKGGVGRWFSGLEMICDRGEGVIAGCMEVWCSLL